MSFLPAVPRALLCALTALAMFSGLRAGNVLVIIADDLGADSFPLTAQAAASLPPMPNLTTLKHSGVLFTRAYGHPVCSPSRAAMLTGRHPFRTGIGAQLTGATSPQLQAAEFTLPEAFAANPATGHEVAMFGKWHLNAGAGTNDTPRTIGGWPHFAGSIGGALPDYSAWTKVTNGVAAATTAYATSDAVDDAIDWITAHGSAPWFAWVALNAPHSPLHQPPLNLHGYDAAAATNRNLYEAMCEAMDTEIGRLLAEVDLTETTVIFIGDNGTPQNVIQPPYTAAHSKGTLYEGGTRVPLIIAGKGVAGPNRSSAVPVHCVDLYATILELAGIDVAATQPAGQAIDSHSVIPVLANTADTPRFAFVEQFGADLTTAQSGQAILDAAGYKLIQFDDGHEEFYKTATDLNEATTLLGNVALSAADQAAYAALKLEMANLPYQIASGAAANDFDLNEYNVRFCVTPEFPAGTWAYFLCIGEDGLPVFPYQVGRSYYGDPRGGIVTSDSEPVTTSFIGGPATAEKAGGASVNGDDVTVTWQAVEGGIYTVEASANLTTWAPVATGVVAAGGDVGSLTENNVVQPPATKRFYRASRTGISTYDRTGFAGTVASASPVNGGGPNTVTPNSGARGSSVTVVIELDPALTPNLPPANVAVFSVTVAGGGVTTSAITRPSQTLVQVTFAIDALAATGARNVSVRFNNATGPQRTIAGAFTVN